MVYAGMSSEKKLFLTFKITFVVLQRKAYFLSYDMENFTMRILLLQERIERNLRKPRTD